jgi:hypothetical protein
MAMQEIPTQEDLIFYEILRHPALCWEFLQNVDRPEHEEEFELTDYELEFCCDFHMEVSFCCGRTVGKTESISGITTWAMINNVFPDDYILYTVPNKVHLEPVWARITREFRTNSVLKHFIYPKKGINSSTFTITLLNGAILICRIAGTAGDGRNVIGLHTPFEMVDEAGYYPWPTWIELNPTLNTWTPGVRRIVSGVPTGFRENNILYHVDMQNSDYTKHRIPQHRNPRHSEDDEQRNIELYGGTDSDDYIHLVLGRHGKPTFAVFDRSLMSIQTYPVYNIKLNGIELREDISKYIEYLSALPGLGNKKSIIGVDLGYTDPTAILVLYLTRNGQFKFHARIQLNKVQYPIQSQIIDYLDTKFNPILIGIDEGHAGTAEVQKLQLEARFAHKNYKERLIPIRFNANVVLGVDEEGKEIKQKTRPYSISVLQEYSNSHRIIYSTTDLELISELERMVYIKTPSGNRVYRTITPKGGKGGDDHFTSALLCSTMAWYLENESIDAQPKRQKLFVGKFLT